MWDQIAPELWARGEQGAHMNVYSNVRAPTPGYFKLLPIFSLIGGLGNIFNARGEWGRIAPELWPRGGRSDDWWLRSGERPARVIVLQLSPDIFSTNAPAFSSVPHRIVLHRNFVGFLVPEYFRRRWKVCPSYPTLFRVAPLSEISMPLKRKERCGALVRAKGALHPGRRLDLRRLHQH